MTGSAALMQPSWEQSTGAGTTAGDREQLTHLLRSLAARLDHLDRRITDLAWHQRRPQSVLGFGETPCERAALESERARLNERLGVLAKQLRILDSRGAGEVHRSHGRVGTCPYCGYPSLASGLCAFCRPHIAH